MARRRRPRARTGAALLVAVALSAALLATATGGAATAADAPAIPRPQGAGPPVKASGMGTQAALDNPRCRHDDPKYGPYGSFDTTQIGGGTACVKPWKEGADNGGATTQGVTADAITIVVVTRNEDAGAPGGATRRSDNGGGRFSDAIHDYLIPEMRFFETWGRDLDVRFVTTSGADEESQRADAVTIEAMHPFAALVLVTAPDLDVLEGELAAQKIVTFGYGSTVDAFRAQAPYLWGQSDQQAAAINVAEVLGKQLVGKKAKYAGDDLKAQDRRFGVVYQEGTITYPDFVQAFTAQGGTIATDASVPSTDPVELQQAAPTLIARMKSAGVTTVVPFANYTALQIFMQAATAQDWYPEWFLTSAQFNDLGLVARSYPPEQAKHAFGISFVPPYVTGDTAYTDQVNVLNWYWGTGVGTSADRITSPFSGWLLAGIQAAGPDLTPKTFGQGLFASPAHGGASDGHTELPMTGFGRTAGLPYDEYAITGIDFAPYWWDPVTEGPSNGTGTVAKGVGWFPAQAKRYIAGTWPTKPIAWFDTSTSITSFANPPVARNGYVGDCKNCPSTGGSGTAGTPNDSKITVPAYDASSAA
jgi:hypothetical protein